VKLVKFFWKEIFITLGITVVGVVVANFCMDYFVARFTNYGFLTEQMHIATLQLYLFTYSDLLSCNEWVGFKKRNCSGKSQCLYYFGFILHIPFVFKQNYGLDYYLYAKVATGWLVFLGYLFFILFIE
jgi:hypothetical protein